MLCAHLDPNPQVHKNATSLANRFRNLSALKLLLTQEMSAITNHQAAALRQLLELQAAVSRPDGGPDVQLVEQASQCGRCRCVCVCVSARDEGAMPLLAHRRVQAANSRVCSPACMLCVCCAPTLPGLAPRACWARCAGTASWMRS